MPAPGRRAVIGLAIVPPAPRRGVNLRDSVRPDTVHGSTLGRARVPNTAPGPRFRGFVPWHRSCLIGAHEHLDSRDTATSPPPGGPWRRAAIGAHPVARQRHPPHARRSADRPGAPCRPVSHRRRGDGRIERGGAQDATPDPRRDHGDGAAPGMEPGLQGAQVPGVTRGADPGPSGRTLGPARRAPRISRGRTRSSASNRAVARSQSKRVAISSRPCCAMRARSAASSTS